jgi:hypothetical protein
MAEVQALQEHMPALARSVSKGPPRTAGTHLAYVARIAAAILQAVLFVDRKR